MTRWQFSIATLLIGTAAAATWLSALLVFWPLPGPFLGGWFLELIQLSMLFTATFGIHRILRNKPHAWTISGLISGLAVLAYSYWMC